MNWGTILPIVAGTACFVVIGVAIINTVAGDGGGVNYGDVSGVNYGGGKRISKNRRTRRRK